MCISSLCTPPHEHNSLARVYIRTISLPCVVPARPSLCIWCSSHPTSTSVELCGNTVTQPSSLCIHRVKLYWIRSLLSSLYPCPVEQGRRLLKARAGTWADTGAQVLQPTVLAPELWHISITSVSHLHLACYGQELLSLWPAKWSVEQRL